MTWTGHIVRVAVRSDATASAAWQTAAAARLLAVSVSVPVPGRRLLPSRAQSGLARRAFSADSGSGSEGGGAGARALRDRLRDLRSNGTPEIVFGFALLGLLAADRFVQAQQRNGRDQVVRMLEREVRTDEERAAAGGGDAGPFPSDVRDRPALFRCAVRRAPRNFDGTKCLTGIREGDVVDVLEEGVGPGGAYNLCRVCKERGDEEGRASVGWFPMTCLEKLPQ